MRMFLNFEEFLNERMFPHLFGKSRAEHHADHAEKNPRQFPTELPDIQWMEDSFELKAWYQMKGSRESSYYEFFDGGNCIFWGDIFVSHNEPIKKTIFHILNTLSQSEHEFTDGLRFLHPDQMKWMRSHQRRALEEIALRMADELSR